jgi:plasmid stability protein
MKNVTITLPDDLARKARVEAAKADKSLSRFVADMLAERCKGEPVPADDADKLGPLREFFYGPGYPGISKVWKARDALYAEREDELLRRYESHRLRDGPGGDGKALVREGFSGSDHQAPYVGAEPAKPKRVLSRRNRKARPDAKK